MNHRTSVPKKARWRVATRVARLGAAVLCAALLVAVGLFLYQAAAEANDNVRYPPSGQLIDVGGFRLHLDCRGEGSPTIVLEGGLGGPALEWALIQERLQNETRVCSYDRAGLGWSDVGPLPRTANEMARELHTLLQNAGVEGPFLLVGHSLGGFIVRAFAHLYPSETAGVVLVASGNENDNAEMPPEYARIEQSNKQTDRLLATLSHFAVMRIAGNVGLLSSYTDLLSKFSPEKRAEFLARTFYRAEYWTTSFEELSALDETRRQMSESGTLGILPLVVLSGSPDVSRLPPSFPVAQIKTTFATLQAELAVLSTHSIHIVCETCDHYIPMTNPDIVVDAINQARAAIEAK